MILELGVWNQKIIILLILRKKFSTISSYIFSEIVYKNQLTQKDRIQQFQTFIPSMEKRRGKSELNKRKKKWDPKKKDRPYLQSTRRNALAVKLIFPNAFSEAKQFPRVVKKIPTTQYSTSLKLHKKERKKSHFFFVPK